jgi:hypothetical protein
MAAVQPEPWLWALITTTTTWVWRRLNNEKPEDLYSSPNFIPVIKKEMGGHVQYGRGEGKQKCIQGFGWET